jgi:FHS family L-fucose permease-like MFS transporter
MEMPRTQFEILKQSDLNTIIQPYLYVAAAIFLLITLIAVTKFYIHRPEKDDTVLGASFRRLLHFRNYWEGVAAEFFYIGAQVCIFTYIIVYGKHVFMNEGMQEMYAEAQAGRYYMYAMMLFAAMRFLCTWLLMFIAPGRLLSVMAITCMATILGSMVFTDRNGLYCLLIACGSMSMMFPTIYGMALRNIGDNVNYASAGLTMTVFAGAVFPPIQAAIIEWGKDILGLSAVNISFIVPFICLTVVVYYGHSGYVRQHITHDYQS